MHLRQHALSCLIAIAALVRRRLVNVQRGASCTKREDKRDCLEERADFEGSFWPVINVFILSVDCVLW